MSGIDSKALRKFLKYDQATGVFTWRISSGSKVKGSVAGSLTSEGYLNVSINKNKQYLHRMAWLYVHGSMPTGVVDHINGIRTDNRIENLRDVSVKDNVQNIRIAKVDNKSGALGVSWHKSNERWQASIRIDGRCKFLGYFDTVAEAHKAYVDAKRIHHKSCSI